MPHKKQGFSILEMAIVLGVVGVILGAFFIEQSIQRASQLISVVSEVDRFRKATQLFKEKYNYLPGDLPTATDFWGTDTNCADQTLGASITLKKPTCPGNGDGFVGDSTGTPFGGATNWPESYRFWQQLADGEFIPGAYSGVLSSRTLGNSADPGKNVAASKLVGSGFTMLYSKPTSPVAVTGNVGGVFGANYRHVFVLGKPATTASTPSTASTYFPALSPAEALSIDAKIDDGLPGMGNVLSFTTAVNACATSVTESTAAYNTTSQGIQCSLIFITGF